MHCTTLEDLLFSYGSVAATSLELSETRGDEDPIGRAEFRGALLFLSYVLEADEHGLTDDGLRQLQWLIDRAREKGFLDDDG